MNVYPQDYDELLTHLLSFMSMPDQFGALLFPKLIGPFTAETHLCVLKPGDISQMAFWPIDGYIRRYTKFKPEQDREYEEEKTTDISIPKKIYLPSDSFMNQVPADYYLEIRKGTTYIGFPYAAFVELGAIMPEVHQLATKILADAEKDWMKKIEICKVNTKVAYEEFLDYFKDPTSNRFIYQKHIASYIGKSEEELSRILKSEK